jgi:hypothetical protein
LAFATSACVVVGISNDYIGTLVDKIPVSGTCLIN